MATASSPPPTSTRCIWPNLGQADSTVSAGGQARGAKPRLSPLRAVPLILMLFSSWCRRRTSRWSRLCASATMLSQLFRHFTTIRRNSFGYRPTRLFATRSSFPCKVCLSECLSLRGQSKSGKHALLGPFDAAPGSTPPRFDCVCMASHASTNQRRFIAACWEPKLAPCAVSGDRERR